MRVMAVQLDTVWQDKQASQARVDALLEGVKIEPGAFVILPETFDTGFGGEVNTVVEPEAGAGWRFLSRLALDRKAYVMGGVVHRARDGRGLNVALVFDPQGREFARYTKLHPFTYSGEAKSFQPGDEIVTFQWRDVPVAPFICYDLRFPEVYRLAAWRGVELFPVIANWPSARVEHWIALLRARAIENQAYVVGVNRCGRDAQHVYPGRSMVIDPWGKVLADGGEGECVVSAELDFNPCGCIARSFRLWRTCVASFCARTIIARRKPPPHAFARGGGGGRRGRSRGKPNSRTGVSLPD